MLLIKKTIWEEILTEVLKAVKKDREAMTQTESLVLVRSLRTLKKSCLRILVNKHLTFF